MGENKVTEVLAMNLNEEKKRMLDFLESLYLLSKSRLLNRIQFQILKIKFNWRTVIYYYFSIC
ncbi:hypothetical protein [Flavobacterium urumqiense]|uniref:hypothetical protein n=1 Tax=Flavobacterium urumqiense TaxID=935224 RepID=UPI003CC542F1